ncbi:MAG TPA: coenzyme F420-0:L-glutamate ligase [bacterium]|nr:coenzyme F420-0:L-glutamate ligase [bacterium]
MRYTGTVVRGIRTPIIKSGDNLPELVLNSVKKAAKTEKFKLNNRDIIGITEAVVSISQNNYVNTKDISTEIKKKFPVKEIALVFPILSRNRFSLILESIAGVYDKVHVLLSYPADEVGNHLMNPEEVENSNLNIYTDCFGEKKYRKLFGEEVKHEFTGVDYVKYYKELGKGNIKVYFANDPRYILKYCKNVLICSIHSRKRDKKLIKKNGGKIVFGLEDICNKKTNKRGFCPEYGLLGSNKVGEDRLKLFPREGDAFVKKVRDLFFKKTGKKVEVLIYGDGAFKDPVGKIWELADPVVSPGFTDGLKGRLKEIKLKYISENWDGKGNLDNYVKEAIKEKNTKEYKVEKSLGTTPRQITDLIGSLCDLTSGSGDKGTPVVLIQGYFDDYTVS